MGLGKDISKLAHNCDGNQSSSRLNLLKKALLCIHGALGYRTVRLPIHMLDESFAQD